MEIFNTLTRKIEKFKSLHEKKVSMYVCGPTPYDKSHIGHARTYIFFDFFRRFLEYKGYEVNYIINLTDIDDKIINRAREKKIPWQNLPDKYSRYFFWMMEKLRIRMPTTFPKVTNHISEIIEFVQNLIDKGYAYKISDGIYFDTTKFKDYGKFSNVNLSDAEVSKIDKTIEKKNKRDFAVWKFKKENEPFWFAPFGEGRPGWHIECSAMANKHLGEHFDIHGGGMDLIFPHHENEIAQSQCTLNETWVTYWMHVAYLTIDKKKMSKSLGNFIGMQEILDTFKPEVIRYYLLSAHYRTQLDFTYDKLKKSKTQWEKVVRAYFEVIQNDENNTYGNEDMTSEIKESFDHMIESLENDLKTPEAYKHINFIASFVLSNKLNKASNDLAKQAFEKIDEIFAILPKKPWNKTEENLANLLASMREEFRKLDRYDLSDTIRDKLKDNKIQIEDTKEGPKVKFEV